MLIDSLSSAAQAYSIIIIIIATSITIFSTMSIIDVFTIIPHVSYAHLYGNRTQEWINNRDGIKIQFTYQPEKPIIDTFTELKFSVQNLTTSDHLKDFTARVVVTNGQRLFKFENITAPNGDFSVKYIFPDDGTHQVVARINEKNFATLASFNVFVPHQSGPSILDPFPSSPGATGNNETLLASKVLAILLPAAAVISIIFVLKNGRKSKRDKSVNQ
jgi:hypothetical protein